ncbi:hypothetical protein ACFL5Z_02295 [Planctomycetota bacterium]
MRIGPEKAVFDKYIKRLFGRYELQKWKYEFWNWGHKYDDALSECYFAYLENNGLPKKERFAAVKKHLIEWGQDRYVSRSDRSCSVNHPPEPEIEGWLEFDRDGEYIRCAWSKKRPERDESLLNGDAALGRQLAGHTYSPFYKDGWPDTGLSGPYRYPRWRHKATADEIKQRAAEMYQRKVVGDYYNLMACFNDPCSDDHNHKGVTQWLPMYYFFLPDPRCSRSGCNRGASVIVKGEYYLCLDHDKEEALRNPREWMLAWTSGEYASIPWNARICWECYLARGIDRDKLRRLYINVLNRLVEVRVITPKQAEVWAMRCLDRLLESEIAQKLEKTVRNIEKIIERTKKRFGCALYINRGTNLQRRFKAIRTYEARFRWYQAPTYRLPSKVLLQSAMTGEKIRFRRSEYENYDRDPLELMEQQCRPSEWPPSSSFLCSGSEVEMYYRKDTRKENPLFSLTGESGLNWGIGSYVVPIETCPSCLSLIKVGHGEHEGRCPKCRAKWRRCKNVNCRRVLSADLRSCPRCDTPFELRQEREETCTKRIKRLRAQGVLPFAVSRIIHPHTFSIFSPTS